MVDLPQRGEWTAELKSAPLLTQAFSPIFLLDPVFSFPYTLPIKSQLLIKLNSIKYIALLRWFYSQGSFVQLFIIEGGSKETP
jgi:hypothetical protein